MIVDSIGIYEMKGPYYTLTMTDWFLQALSVIPRGSSGDVSTRFIMVRWCTGLPIPMQTRKAQFVEYSRRKDGNRSDLIVDRDYDEATTMDVKPMFPGPGPDPSPLTCRVVARRLRRRTSLRSSRQGDSANEIFVGVLVHSSVGIGKPVVDRIRSNQRSAISIGEIVGDRSLVTRQEGHGGTVACALWHCSCTQLQCRWPATVRDVRAGGRPRAQTLHAGARAACGSVPHAVQAVGAPCGHRSAYPRRCCDTVFDF
ncbi:hypothetical protein F511_10883 [Dorcoceras hygrometricum]|uniref:Uncharacterized protein n=1 Tax=Dorcoceras hygrometricum TaxID=472368 RepID=A0A2Z7A7H2_9LAMI|nr:hypothetical protein F511_10883 [Dorcoceras hygrometricum]